MKKHRTIIKKELLRNVIPDWILDDDDIGYNNN